ncbi:hypothetical protein C8Q79DRAFT_305272 [Trametes meyenii]|nr:hypothetical protein C8Q79DRAFT_305272 [Trametes meyenii]
MHFSSRLLVIADITSHSTSISTMFPARTPTGPRRTLRCARPPALSSPLKASARARFQMTGQTRQKNLRMNRRALQKGPFTENPAENYWPGSKIPMATMATIMHPAMRTMLPRSGSRTLPVLYCSRAPTGNSPSATPRSRFVRMSPKLKREDSIQRKLPVRVKHASDAGCNASLLAILLPARQQARWPPSIQFKVRIMGMWLSSVLHPALSRAHGNG